MADLTCDCCRRERAAKGQDARPLLGFALGKEGKSLYLCEYCDGEEVVGLVDKNDADPLT